jgi:biotin-dependent carboxylase-like uncharacterized protein
MLRLTSPGPQSTLQGRPRSGKRHLGVPASGPADALSMALANRLVGNGVHDTAVEISYGGFSAVCEVACTIAVTGAHGRIELAGAEAPGHATLRLRAGDTFSIAPPRFGVRAYLAITTGFEAETFLGSASTYLPAGFGGCGGRALAAGDRLRPDGPAGAVPETQTPAHLRPVLTAAFALRACVSAEADRLAPASRQALFEADFAAGRQATRMGLSLTGHTLELSDAGPMRSAPVFPGTLQCPPSGTPIVLLCDAQTTGGYPRIASIARCDRHLLGQIRPGNAVRLLRRDARAAAEAFTQKAALLGDWLPGGRASVLAALA